MQGDDVVLSLVWAWLQENPSVWSTWVPPYVQIRYLDSEQGLCVVRVGGHYRRRARDGNLPAALALVSKFDKPVRSVLIRTRPSRRTRYEARLTESCGAA
jgi:hypothetical protein